MSHKQDLADKANYNYELLKSRQLGCTKPEIIENAFMIDSYRRLRDYFTDDNALSEDTCKFLFEFCGQEVLDILFDDYTGYEPYSLETAETITAFIEDYRAVNDENYKSDESGM